jgi:hypothetical protein
MKTINHVQKTENRNPKNTTSKTFAVVASLVLISLTVSANGFWKQILVNNAYGKMAVLMVKQTNNPASPLLNQPSAGISSNAWLFETTKERELPVESWMTSNKYFSSSTRSEQLSPENTLEIESWMPDNPYFSNSTAEAENEPALPIENWMTDPTIWGPSK